MTITRPTREPDLDAEQEVDLGSYWDAIVARWWLPLLGLLAGALIGYVLSLGGSDVYRASATVYLGQPLGAVGNALIQSAATNPTTVRAIIQSESVLRRVARDSGMRVGDLRGHVSSQTVTSGTRVVGQNNPNVTVTVTGHSAQKVERAANALARAVVTTTAVAGYANRKIANLKAEIASDERLIEGITRRLDRGGGSSTEALLLQLRLQSLEQDRNTATQLLAQAQLVERPRLVTRAAAFQTTARSRRNTVVVAAVLGLLLGLLAALLWEPIVRRRA